MKMVRKNEQEGKFEIISAIRLEIMEAKIEK
jgi:hypothetical protein